MKLIVEEQVRTFIRNLPPEPRKALKHALRRLENEEGDIKAMSGELERCWRLRVKEYRVIFAYRERSNERYLHCIFAERRSLVYELFSHIARELQ